MDSVWIDTATMPRFDSLQRDEKTDVLIIGGGISGILCAYMLKQAGVNYMLVEAKRICSGITKNTTAKVTLQHGMIYEKITKRYGESFAKAYLEAQRGAMQEYEKLCANIDCDYEIKDSYVYSRGSREKLEKEVLALNNIGCDARFVDNISLPFSTAGAVCVKNQAQFHPLKFLAEIANDLNIYENTKVLEIRDDRAITNRGTVTFKKCIVATHFPFINKHGAYFLKLYQHRSYVIALENAENVHGMYIDATEGGMSFRNYENLLLIGGGSHRTGKDGGSFSELFDFARKYYPNARAAYEWATQDCMTLDGIPYIGLYSKRTPNLYVATGFNKWGMTSAMVSAALLKDLILGRNNDFAEVFSPSRTVLHPQLAINTGEALIGLLTPSVPRCPHMGCALKYNKQEHSWDCSCHGSRFDEHGELIDNPATSDKK